MKLQLLSEDVEAALADSSSRALQRIPVAVQEVSRVKVRWAMLPRPTPAGPKPVDSQRAHLYHQASSRVPSYQVRPIASLWRLLRRR